MVDSRMKYTKKLSQEQGRGPRPSESATGEAAEAGASLANRRPACLRQVGRCRLTKPDAGAAGRSPQPAFEMVSKCKESLSSLLAPHAGPAEQYLTRWLIEPDTPAELAEAMRYCVLSSGKRLRPALVLMVAEAAGQEVTDELTARAAVAVELVHCYSMVHDDLPSMDDDELRRGQPTAHVKFGQAMAILAGDALLTRAFGMLAETLPPPRGQEADERAILLVAELARGAGPAGMVAGQVADMGLCQLPPGLEGLDYIPLRKTGALIRAAGRMGAICSRANRQAIQAVSEYTEAIGLAYQLVDDILDVTAQADTLGKTPGKDQASGKMTHVAQLGLDRACELADELTARAVVAIEPLGDKGEGLRKLAKLLAERTH